MPSLYGGDELVQGLWEDVASAPRPWREVGDGGQQGHERKVQRMESVQKHQRAGQAAAAAEVKGHRAALRGCVSERSRTVRKFYHYRIGTRSMARGYKQH